MTLYKGENAEEIVRYLETDEYFYRARNKLYNNDDSMCVRAMFSVLDDDGHMCPTDELCYCHWYPGMPLASTTWTADDEKAWLEEEILPELPLQVYNTYFKDYLRLRDKWAAYYRERKAEANA
jgi:hypothetical protein